MNTAPDMSNVPSAPVSSVSTKIRDAFQVFDDAAAERVELEAALKAANARQIEACFAIATLRGWEKGTKMTPQQSKMLHPVTKQKLTLVVKVNRAGADTAFFRGLGATDDYEEV